MKEEADPDGNPPAQTRPVIPCCCLAIVGMLFALFIIDAIFLEIYGSKPMPSSCLFNLKELDLAVQMYIQDYDERLPLSASWNEDLLPYTVGHSKSNFRCPQEPNQKVPSYAFNGRLHKLPLGKVESPEGTVVVFDSIPGKNLAGGKELLPFPSRHTLDDIGCYNFGFLDGHAKTYKITQLAKLNWDPNKRVKKEDDQK